MRAILITIVLMANCIFANGQESDSINKKLFTPVNQEAGYRGGEAAFLKFFSKNFKYPKTKNNYFGKIIIEFAIEKSGRLSNIQVTPNLSSELYDEIVRVMKIGKWNVSIQDGRPQRAIRKIPLYIEPE